MLRIRATILAVALGLTLAFSALPDAHAGPPVNPFTVGWHALTLDVALDLETNPPALVVAPWLLTYGITIDYADVLWPLGSPSNTALAMAHTRVLDPIGPDPGGAAKDISIYGTNHADVVRAGVWPVDIGSPYHGYYFTRRNSRGVPAVISEEGVLALIDRRLGQRGR